MSDAPTTREARLRRRAAREGLALRKDRGRTWTLDRQGGYMLLDSFRNWIVAGARFELDLDDVEQWLARD